MFLLILRKSIRWHFRNSFQFLCFKVNLLRWHSIYKWNNSITILMDSHFSELSQHTWVELCVAPKETVWAESIIHTHATTGDWKWNIEKSWPYLARYKQIRDRPGQLPERNDHAHSQWTQRNRRLLKKNCGCTLRLRPGNAENVPSMLDLH
jgi:hypothetical protein